MNSHKKILLILFCLINFGLVAQTKKEIEETYKDANSYFYFEDYEEALALYLQVYKHQPDNANLNYRIGFCYLNIPGSKDKSISFLKNATANIAKNYSEESVLETKAPVDALFYLGNAYFVNNQIDNALAQYKKFSDLTKGKGQWNFDYLSHQITSAKNSVTLQKTPINYLQLNLGETINDRFANYNSVISGDGKTLAYTTKRRFYQAVFVSHLDKNGEWTTPKNITLDLQVDGNCSTLSLSFDGTELYLFKDDNHDGNIYVSRLRSGKWTPMLKLNKNINSESYETHASLSPDGKRLYFSSNRIDGYGDLDIYVSERSVGDDWGIPVNLGPTINTPFNENTPFISNDGNMLFFSSEGHNNMGGYDIFISQLTTNNQWTTPINIGFPINTTDDNLFYHPIGNGSKGLMAIFDTDGFGEQDICEVELFIPKFMKNILSSTSFADRIEDKNFKRIVVDTLNTGGIALMDIAHSDIPLKIDSQKKYKLFFEGKSFDVREKVSSVDRLLAKAEQPKVENISVQTPTATTSKEDTANSQIQNRIDLLKQFNDTNNSESFQENKSNGASNSISSGQEYSGEAGSRNNVLTEILLMLAPKNSQTILTKALKRDWNFDKNQLNEKVIGFARSFETIEEKDAITMALASLADKINSLELTNEQGKRSRNISSTTNSSFYHFYNQLINLASPELSKLLAATLVNNPNTQSIEALLLNFKKQNPVNYNTYLPELLRIIAKSAIGNYINLSDNQKFNLYNSLTQAPEEKTSNWWICIIALFILVSAIGMYLYFRKSSDK